MARSTRLGIGIGTAALMGGVLVFGAMAHADSPAAAAAPGSAGTVLVEQPGCSQPELPAAPTAVAPVNAAGELTQTVTITVPPTALLTVDLDGRIVEATTNTGCAPRATDDLYLVLPDGSVTEATDPLPERAWVGDFTAAGVAVAQTP